MVLRVALRERQLRSEQHVDGHEVRLVGREHGGVPHVLGLEQVAAAAVDREEAIVQAHVVIPRLVVHRRELRAHRHGVQRRKVRGRLARGVRAREHTAVHRGELEALLDVRHLHAVLGVRTDVEGFGVTAPVLVMQLGHEERQRAELRAARLGLTRRLADGLQCGAPADVLARLLVVTVHLVHDEDPVGEGLGRELLVVVPVGVVERVQAVAEDGNGHVCELLCGTIRRVHFNEENHGEIRSDERALADRNECFFRWERDAIAECTNHHGNLAVSDLELHCAAPCAEGDLKSVATEHAIHLGALDARVVARGDEVVVQRVRHLVEHLVVRRFEPRVLAGVGDELAELSEVDGLRIGADRLHQRACRLERNLLALRDEQKVTELLRRHKKRSVLVDIVQEQVLKLRPQSDAIHEQAELLVVQTAVSVDVDLVELLAQNVA
mmetsp:Transcript_31582/g.97565  ORF Transcript_31582/g.97565 Transcript_31582/m.97565 type:complete len:439 (-) Transcript_31582:585-1901(-)